MSLDATTWARHQKVGKGPAKSVLMALADYANEHFAAYRFFVKRWQWVTEDLAWVEALIALNPNALRPFLDSGDEEWRAEVTV